MKRSPVFLTGFAICALLGVLDAGSLAGIGADNGPPVVITLASVVLGIVTIAGCVLLWRGNRSGQITVIASRVLSALLGVPVFFVSDAPSWARPVVGVVIVLTVVGVALLVADARRAQPAT